MSKLNIGTEGFSLPLDFVTQTQAILAIKGAGKTNTAVVQCEELLKAEQQVIIADPTGAWWGLKSSADGRSAGFPVAIFGGEHADVPLEEAAGEIVADAIVTGRFSAILDLSLFRKGQMYRFMAPFLETLYRRNRDAMHLVIDEADMLAPQKPFADQARTLGAMEDIVRRGRIRGIGCTVITQRPQVLNKDVLTQAEMLCCLRMSHPKDIGAIKEWVDVHADAATAKQMIASLPVLKNGTGWFWAPSSGIFDKVTVRVRETFDSSATPKAGRTVTAPKVVAQIDLQRLGEQISATVQKQKENDPKALKARIAQLEKQLSESEHTTTIQIDQSAIDRAVVEAVAMRDEHWKVSCAEHRTRLSEIVEECVDKFHRQIGSGPVEPAALKSPKAHAAAASVPTPVLKRQPGAEPPERPQPAFTFGSSAGAQGNRAVLDAFNQGVKDRAEAAGLSGPQLQLLVQLREFDACAIPQVKVSWLASSLGTTARSRGFEVNLQTVKRLHLVENNGNESVRLTQQGVAITGIRPTLVGGARRAKVLSLLSGPQADYLQLLYRNKRMPLDQLAAAFDTTVRARGFEVNIQTLRRNGLIETREGHAVLASFLEAE